MKERIVPVVDENDRIICYKKWGELKPSDITRVAALLLTNPKGEILIAKRAESKLHDPGKWENAANGTVEKGETYRQNIVKEAWEELGVRNPKIRKGPKFRRSSSHEFFVQYFFAGTDKPASAFRIPRSERSAVKWVPLKKVSAMAKKDRTAFVRSASLWLSLLTKKKK